MPLTTIIDQAPLFMVVFIRIGAFIAFVPFFNDQNYIMAVKVGIAFFMSVLLFPVIDTATWHIPGNAAQFILMVAQEVLVGLLIGLTFLIILFGLQLAGRIVSFQMAFSMANVVDSTFGAQSNVLSVLLVMLGTMLIIAMGGDHYLLYSLKKSFEVLPPGTIAVTRSLVDELSAMVVKSFEIGFKLASPAVILLLSIDLTLGLIGKTASKMQIFFVGLPLKISVGLFSISLILGFVLSIWGKEVPLLPDYLLRLFGLMRV